VFSRRGVRSPNMDDIARELKVSKKTLSKYFKDKSDLVAKVMTAKCVFEQMQVTRMIADSENAIDELMHMTEMISKELAQVHPSVHYDLEKYYPEAWKVFLEHKQTFVRECVKANLQRGVEQGIYRDNLNADIISKLYVSKIDVIFDPSVFPVGEFTFAQVHLELMRYHIRGVANNKGMKYLADKITKEHSNL
jgi:AcrR family transcriptional regulator